MCIRDSDGSPEFTIEDTDKAERGTDIVLYIDDDCKEFLEEARISSLLKMCIRDRHTSKY